MRKFATLVITAAIGAASPAFACTPVPSEPPTRQQIEDGYERAFLRADTVGRVIILSSPSARHGGRARVLSVVKGAVRVGDVIRFVRRSDDTCNLYQTIAPGDRGMIAVNISAPDFRSFLSADAVAVLHRRGRLRSNSQDE